MPAFLFSQPLDKYIIGGDLAFDHLDFQSSPDGQRKDFKIGVHSRFLVKLSDSTDSMPRIFHQKHSSPNYFWVGSLIGISSYLSNRDSMNVVQTEIILGPIIRYYTSEKIFVELSGYFLLNRVKVNTPDPIGVGNWYIPVSNYYRLGCLLNVGYSLSIAKGILFEPILGVGTEWNLNPTINEDKFDLDERKFNLHGAIGFYYSF
ncbi:MAG: hypothetical protein R2751_03290 [Bacteroidales bacterium]